MNFQNMNFQNIAANMEAGAAADPNKPAEEQPWYIKYGVRGLGTIAGGLAMLLGATNTIFSVFSPTCIIFSIWQILVGFVVTTIESPCCFFFVDHVQAITNRIQSKPLYIKAAVYVAAPLPSLIFCMGVSTFLGSGLIIATGVVYGFLALGKKASREEMARTAQSMAAPPPPPTSVATDKAGLVDNLRDPKPNPLSGSYEKSYQANGPPPSYTESNSTSTGGARPGWDTSYTTATLETPTYNPSGSVVTGSVNPVPSTPYNPFQ